MKTSFLSFQTALCAVAIACASVLPSFSASASAQDKVKADRAELAQRIEKIAPVLDAKSKEKAAAAVETAAPDSPSVASNYAFATATNASLTDMSTGTTQLVAANQDDTASSVTNIGFEFFFQGVRYTQFSANSNGLVRLGGSAVQTASPYKPLAQSGIPLITAYGADQRTHTSGKVHFKVTGAAPNRVLIVEWLNMQANFNSGGTADLTYQARLHEATGVIEHIYGSMTMSTLGAADTNSRDPHIGFSSTNTAGNVGSVTAPQSGTPDPTFNGASATPVANLYTAGAITTLTSASNGSRRIFTYTPPTPTAPTGLNFTGVTATGMTLNWSDSPDELAYAIYRSTDGVNYAFETLAAQNAVSYAATGLNPSTNYFWQVYAVSEGALSSALAGSQMTAAPGMVTSVQSGPWNDTATWGGPVPTSGDNVTIANGHTVTINSSNALNVTVQSGGILEFEDTTARTLTVGQSVVIDAGGIFRTAATGTVVTHVLSVGMNLTNNGTLDFSTNGDTAGAGITFTGAANNTFGGTGATTDVRTVTINKGTSNANILELMPDNFTVRGVTTDTVTGGWLVLTNGTMKVSGTFAGTSRVFSAAAYTIGATQGFWLNNPNYTVAAQAGNAVNNGLFRLSQGVFNQGTLVSHSFRGGTGAQFNIEGGMLNCAAQFSPQSAVTYTQSAGIVNVGLVGNSQSNFATFELFSTTAVFNMSGGTINIVQASTGTTQIDYQNLAISTVTGGTVNVGTAATTVKFTFNIRGNLPNLVIDNTTNNKTATATAQLNLRGTTTINAGSTMVINGQVCLVIGPTFTNNGTLTGTAASTRFYFLGGLGATTYNGSGVVTAPLTQFEVDNVAGVTIDPAVNQIVTSRFNNFSGGLTGSNKLTLGNGGATTAVVQLGVNGVTQVVGGFDVAPVFNPGTGGVVNIYAPELTARTTGVEIPPSRTVSTLSVSNTNGIIIAGGDLMVNGTLAGALTMTNAPVTTGANVLHFNGTGAATVVRTGNGHVIGNFKKTYTAAGNKTFEVGTANGFSPVAVNVTAGTFPADFTVATIQGQAPYVSGMDSLQRYWTLTGSDVTADLTFTYLASDVVGDPADYQFIKNDAGMLSTLAPAAAPTTTMATINGVSSFSDWTLADPAGVSPGTLEFVSATYMVSESGPSIAVEVSRTGGADGAVGISFATADGTAVDPDDYDSQMGTLSWANGDSANKMITIPITDDMVFEQPENFTVALNTPTGGASLGAIDMTTVTINDDDNAPSFSIDNVSMSEGDSGTTNFVFTVTKNGMSAGSSSVDFATMDGTATTADSDYVATSGTLNFTSAQTTQMVTVQVNGDTKFEQDETFTVVLSNVMNDRGEHVAGDPLVGTGTIQNDDGAPTFTIDNVSMNEGDSGTTNFVFTVTKNGMTGGSSSVDFATMDGTATTADSDYVANSGTLNFTAAQTTQMITVQVNGDTNVETDEEFTVVLSNIMNDRGERIEGQNPTGTGTILNDDIAPANVTVNPGAGSYATLKDAFDAINAGTHTGAITVSIDADTTETASAVLNASGVGSASYTSISITPNGARTVSGAIAAGSPLIDLNGADNVTIDGLNIIGNSLTLSNTTVASTAGTSTIRFINGASNNIVRNSTILGSSTTAVATAGGTVLISTSTGGANSGNTVANNNIGPAGANLPNKGVMSLGSASPNNNSGNVVDNNNIFDFFNPAVAAAGIRLDGNTTTVTVSNNRIFQTAPRIFTSTALNYAGISGAIGTGAGTATITGNVIGFGAADGTGTTAISGSTGTFAGITFASASTTVPTSIQGNIVSGISHSTAGDAVVVFNGIFFGGGRYDVGTITGNRIGSLDGSSTVTVTLSSNGQVIMLRDGNNTALSNSISNNQIGAITINGTGGGNNGWRGIIAGGTSSGATATVNNNQIGGSGAGGITSTLTGTYAMYAITNSAGNLNASGNIIQNISGNSTAPSLIVSSGMLLTGTGTAGGPNVISRNVIHSLSNNSGSASNSIYALYCSFPAATANVVERNFVHSLSITSTNLAAQIAGILPVAGTGTYRNNMVRLGVDAAGNSITGGYNILAMFEINGTNNLYHNSVYVGGSGVTAVSSTFAFVSNVATNARNYFDNIFWNARSNASGTGGNYAIAVGGTTMNPPGLMSNYNDLYATGTAGFVGLFNGVNQPTLANWQAATGQDMNSISANPGFVHPSGTAATVDLHLDCDSAALDAGITVGGVTDDFDGDPRLNPPDIGADEVTFTAPTAVSAVSRKTHGAAGDFDVSLPFAGPVGIEPRSGGVNGDFQVVVTFATPVTVGSADVTSGTGTTGMVSGSGTTTITIDLTGVTNAQYITLTLGCVDDGVNLGNVDITMGVLVGDVNGSGAVNGTDVGIVKSEAGQPVTASNFTSDVIANGNVNASDVGQVKAASGSMLPPVAAP